jgi:hypothetical protein
MARQTGPPFHTGKLGNLLYYKRGNDYFVRRMPAPRGKQIKKGENFKGTRDGNREFSGGSTISKTFREGLLPLKEIFTDSYFSSRLTGTFRRLIKIGEGKEGSRKAMIGGQGYLLKDFQFNKQTNFDHVI